MTRQQITWAAQQDWFLGYECPTPGEYIAVCRNDDPDVYEVREFSDYKTLRNWAGY